MKGFDRSAIDALWNLIWTQPRRAEVKALRNLFRPYLDIEETTKDRGFNRLHLILLGLSPISLRAQLQTSTAEIDLPCSSGRTPLNWAVCQSNTEAIQILLEFGANIYLADRFGNTPLHQAARIGTIETLVTLLNAMASGRYKISDTKVHSNIPNRLFLSEHDYSFLNFCLEWQTKAGYTVLTVCVYFQDRTEFARMLLDAGADVDSTFTLPSLCDLHTWVTPLTVAVSRNNHANTRLLLERGARLDLYDIEMQGILHVMATHSDLATMEIFYFEEKIKDLDAEQKDIFNHTPLETFDIARPKWIPEENESTRQECRRAFLQILSRARNGAAYNTSMSWRGKIIEEQDSEGDSEEGEDVFYDCEQSE